VSYKTLLNKVKEYSIVCGEHHDHKDLEA
jgi:hypothetical protein